MNSRLLSIIAMTVSVGCAPNQSAPEHMERARAKPAANCPASDFEGFLRAFTASDAVRAAYTAPFVSVTDWVDVDETARGTSTERVPRDRYSDFRLRHHDGGYVHDQHGDMSDPVPVQPRVTPVPNGYRVEYVFNMSEGNSWMFAASGGCWRLVADPDPSLL